MRLQPSVALLMAVLIVATVLFVWLDWSPTAPAVAGPATTAGARSDATAVPAVAGAADASASPGAATSRVEVETPATSPVATAADRRRDEREPVLVVRTERGDAVTGVPVGVRVVREGHAHLVWRGESQAPDGTVRVEGFRDKVRDGGPPLPEAVLAFPLANAPGVPIDPADVPREPIVLVLPATGQVEVVLDGEGAASAAEVAITLASGETSVKAAAVHGRALFPFVGLGLELEVTAERAGQTQNSRVLGAGPRVHGETVVVHVPMVEPDWRLVVMHVQDDAGAACCDTRLDLRLEARAEGSTTSSSFTATTDGKGTLRWVVDDRLGDAAQRTLQLRTAVGDVQLAHLELPTLRRGDNDLGVVTLQRPSLVCGGLVVDAGGKPIAGASVRVQGRKTSGGSSWWSPEHGLEAKTDADGAFAVRGVPQARELSVSASAKGFLSLESQPFAAGAAGLRLSLDQAAGLAGSLLLGDVLEPGDVVVELLRQGQTEADVERPARRGALGEFEFASLLPGTATVRVRLVGQLRGGVVVEGVALRAGETTRDPRLQEVDLLQGLQRITFTVVDEAFTRVRDAEAFVLDGGPGQSAFEGVLLPQGQGRLFTATASLDLLVYAPGYRWTRAASVFDGQQITLPRAAVVRLRLAADAARVAPPGLRAALQRVDVSGPTEGSTIGYHGTSGTRSSSGTLPWAGGVFGEVGAGGEAVLAVESPGRYSCTWSLGRRANAVHSTLTEVRVSDSDGELVLDAGITAADLATAAAKK